MRNFRDLNDQVSRGKSFSGYERNALFLNRAGNGFSDVGAILGVDFDDDARAVATIDWDRDGDLDMWVANRTAPQVRLLRNNQTSTNAFCCLSFDREWSNDKPRCDRGTIDALAKIGAIVDNRFGLYTPVTAFSLNHRVGFTLVWARPRISN
jgi:hypothetical protein